MLHNGLEGISTAFLTGLDLATDEGHVLQTEVRKNLLSTKIHGYWDMYNGPPLMAYYGCNTTDWLAADSIALLKNDSETLSIRAKTGKSYGLIGDHFKYPALSDGGSAEGAPYYAVTLYDAMIEAVGEENVTYTPGIYTFKFVPFLKILHQPGTNNHGWWVDIFDENPDDNAGAGPVYQTATDKDLVDVPESLHKFLPHKYFVRARASFIPETSSCFRFGFAVAGKGKVKIVNKDVIDLWGDQPPKTEDTPCFNRLSMERFYDVDVESGKKLNIEVLMVNEDVRGGVGTAFTLAG